MYAGIPSFFVRYSTSGLPSRNAVSEMRAAFSPRREQAIVPLCSLIATDASENRTTDFSVFGFYVCACVCFKLRAHLVIRAIRIHALYLCTIVPFYAVFCDVTQICADRLTVLMLLQLAAYLK